jgi:NADH:ubiquinone oxidoreductase subunit
VAPTEEDYKPHPWEQPHMGNPTGTPGAIRPDGSTLRPGPRQATGGDYEAWSPGP